MRMKTYKRRFGTWKSFLCCIKCQFEKSEKSVDILELKSKRIECSAYDHLLNQSNLTFLEVYTKWR